MTATPTDGFVPLTTAAPAAKGREDFRVLVAASSAQARPFRLPDPTAAESGSGPAAAPARCEPAITLERNGDRVTAIHIQCSCGQSIDLVCDYEASPE